MAKLQIRDMVIGEGVPKICVSLMGEDLHVCEREWMLLQDQRFDIVEWRLDYFQESDHMDMVLDCAQALYSKRGNHPLLATFRSLRDGGEKDIQEKEYACLCETLITSSLIDMIDIEYRFSDELKKKIITLANQYDVKVVVSYHDFTCTPSKEEQLQLFQGMQDCGGDIIKLALMPQTMHDVLSVLDATYEMAQKASVPVVSMAMGNLGKITRIAGEFFGSCITFASSQQASAPGQMKIEDVKTILELLHK